MTLFSLEIESVGDDQGKFREIHSARQVTNQRQSVPVASSPDDCRLPETRPNFDRGEDPCRPILASGERANLVRLKLLDSESDGPSVVEATARIGCLLEPARHGVPPDTRDPSDRGDADALDSQCDDRVESSPSMLKTVVRRAFRRTQRLSAFNTPVSTPSPGSRFVRGRSRVVGNPLRRVGLDPTGGASVISANRRVKTLTVVARGLQSARPCTSGWSDW